MQNLLTTILLLAVSQVHSLPPLGSLFSSGPPPPSSISYRCFDSYAFYHNSKANIHCAAVAPEDGEKEDDDFWGLKRRVRHSIEDAIAGNSVEKQRFINNMALFKLDPVENVEVTVNLANATPLAVSLGQTEENGHVDKDVDIQVVSHTNATDIVTRVGVTVILEPNDERRFNAEIKLAGNPKFGVFTDIDDTIKITGVLDKKVMFANAFLKEYLPVIGMPKLFEHYSEIMSADGVDPLFAYVSGTPWQLYDSLLIFLRKYYPWGEIDLQRFTKTPGSIIELTDVEGYKTGQFKIWKSRFPEVKWYLVGDSGQKDPEIYASLYKEFPELISCILIIEVSGFASLSERRLNRQKRFEKAFVEVPLDKWFTIKDPSEVMNLPLGKCRS